MVFHVLNRAVARHALFEKDGDYEAFGRVFGAALEKHPIRVLAYCLMPNHWHLVLWPRRDGDLTNFVRWLTHTHTMRWHAHYHTSGTGHLYQGRFKSFPIEADEHLYTVLRYAPAGDERSPAPPPPLADPPVPSPAESTSPAAKLEQRPTAAPGPVDSFRRWLEILQGKA
jgi:REP element-mobilizing transposase RayT